MRATRHTLPRLLALALCASLVRPSAGADENNKTIEMKHETDINLDVSDPLATREERLERHREVIRRAIELRKKQEEEDIKAKAEGREPRDLSKEGAEEGKKEGEGAGAGKKPGDKTPDGKTAPGKPGDKKDKGKGKGKEERSTLIPGAGAQTAHATLYLTPGSVTVYQGLQFTTTCKIINNDHLYLDRFRIVLDYPEGKVRPVAVHQDHLAGRLEGKAQCEFDEIAGVLTFEAKFAKPSNANSLELLDIVWEAVSPGENLFIYPMNGDDVTMLWFGQERVSSSILGEQGGSSGAFLRVLAPKAGDDDRAVGENYIVDPLSDMRKEIGGMPDQSKIPLPTMWIHQPAASELEAGKWYVVDFGVDNPGKAAFDEVRLAARYDPEAVEIADTDTGNFIQDGVNVLDGPFRSIWSWDGYQRNAVFASRGYFDYRVSTSSEGRQPSGPVCRVFARVKKLPKGPMFEWIWENNPGPDNPSTGLFLLGENIMLRRLGLDDGKIRPAANFNDLLAGHSPGYERADKKDYAF